MLKSNRKPTMTGLESKTITLNPAAKPFAQSTTTQETNPQVTETVRERPAPQILPKTITLNPSKQTTTTLEPVRPNGGGRVINLNPNGNKQVVTGLNPANQIAKPLVNTNVVTTPIRNAPEGSVVRTQPVKDIKPVEKPETKAIVPTPKKEETQAVIAPNLKSLKDSILASTKSKDKSPSQEKIVKPETEKAEPSTQIVEERKSPVVENKELVEKPKEAMVEELPSPHSPQDQKPTAAKSNGDTPVESQDGAQENEDILERKDSSQASPPQELQLETQEGKASEHAVDDFDVVEVNPSPNKIDEEKPSPVNDAEVEKIIAQEAEGSKKIKLSEDNDTISLKSNKSKDSDKLSKASSLSKSQLKFYEKEGEKIKQALSELEELVNSVEKKIPNNYKKVIDFAQRVNKKRSFKERLASLMNFFEKS